MRTLVDRVVLVRRADELWDVRAYAGDVYTGVAEGVSLWEACQVASGIDGDGAAAGDAARAACTTRVYPSRGESDGYKKC